MELYLKALFLGIVEGLTEFLPISSTGHLILLTDIFHMKVIDGWVFEVIIQFGAILAIIVNYRIMLFHHAKNIFTAKNSQKLALVVFIAFFPAMVLGALFHEIIKSILFQPIVVASSLILGGFVLLFLDKKFNKPTVFQIENITPQKGFIVGLIQCLAMIPGVSRSGATIMGGLSMGFDKRTAAEFSFLLAIPTMLGAASYDLYKNYHHLNIDDYALIGCGLFSSFITALFVVRFMIRLVNKYGFSPFAYYRIILGSIILCYLFFTGG
jgi:undecaprenyl-diphosphatase